MALLDMLTGRQSQDEGSSRVPPLAKALAGLLSYSKLKLPGGQTVGSGPEMDRQLEDFFKPAPGGGPTTQGVVGALLTGGLMDLVAQFRGAGHGDAANSWVARGPTSPCRRPSSPRS